MFKVISVISVNNQRNSLLHRFVQSTSSYSAFYRVPGKEGVRFRAVSGSGDVRSTGLLGLRVRWVY